MDGRRLRGRLGREWGRRLWIRKGSVRWLVRKVDSARSRSSGPVNVYRKRRGIGSRRWLRRWGWRLLGRHNRSGERLTAPTANIGCVALQSAPLTEHPPSPRAPFLFHATAYGPCEEGRRHLSACLSHVPAGSGHRSVCGYCGPAIARENDSAHAITCVVGPGPVTEAYYTSSKTATVRQA
jgi:hypothetical protein